MLPKTIDEIANGGLYRQASGVVRAGAIVRPVCSMKDISTLSGGSVDGFARPTYRRTKSMLLRSSLKRPGTAVPARE